MSTAWGWVQAGCIVLMALMAMAGVGVLVGLLADEVMR